MTWAELKLLVNNRLKFDGASSEDLANTTLMSAFDLRAKLSLQEFVRETYYIFEDRAALTLATNDRTISLLDPAKSAKSIYTVYQVWVNNLLLQNLSPRDMQTLSAEASVATGTPSYWAQYQDGQVTFDKKCTSGFSNSYVSGWAKHPDISSDSQVLSIMDWHGSILAAYIAAEFARPVVSSAGGLNRLQMYDKEAYEGALAIKAANTQRFLWSN